MTAKPINLREVRVRAQRIKHEWIYLRVEAVEALIGAVDALDALHAQVEMADKGGVHLPNREPLLDAGVALARFDFGDPS